MQKRTLSKIVAALVVAALTGCASVPSPEVMRAETASFQLPRMPDPGKAMIYVVRPSGLGGLIRFNVFVDDQEAASEMGYTRGSEYIYFQVPPGERRILSKAENWADAQVRVSAGEVVFIKQEPAMGVLMARNSIERIADFQGKYHVKTLTLGTILKPGK
jgi:hypothetical protein